MITVAISDLKAAIKVLGSIIKGKYDRLMITCGENDLRLETVVGEVGISTSIPFEGIRFSHGDIPVAIYFREFKKFVIDYSEKNSSPLSISYDAAEEEVDLSLQGKTITCTSPIGLTTPSKDALISQLPISINKAFIKDLLTVSQVADPEECRVQLNGVYFDDNGTIVATDGHRLMAIQNNKYIFPKMIIPVAAINALKSIDSFSYFLTPVVRQMVEVEGKGKNKKEIKTETLYRVVISDSKYTITANLIEGPYPDYERVIPKKTYPETISFSKKEFLSVIKEAKPLLNKKTHMIKFKVRHGKIVLYLHGESGKHIEHHLRLVFYCKLQSSSSDLERGFKVGFNSKYLSELLNTVNTDEITLAFTHDYTNRPDIFPVLINKADSQRKTLIMPLRIEE